MAQFLKDPQSLLDYTIDWQSHYLPAGVTIVQDQGWTITPAPQTEADLTIIASAHDTGTTTVQVMGGVPGRQYRLTSRIQTSAGQTEERSLWLRIAHR